VQGQAVAYRAIGIQGYDDAQHASSLSSATEHLLTRDGGCG
jgi:hypothetical protein